MPATITTTELFLIAMVDHLRGALRWSGASGRTDYWAPLVVVQILTGIVLGPGLLGAAFPEFYGTVFTPPVVMALNGVAWWAVMLFVWIAGIELDLRQAWKYRARERHHRRPGAGRAAGCGQRGRRGCCCCSRAGWARPRCPGSSCSASAWPAR